MAPGTPLSGLPYYSDQPLDNVRWIVVGFLVEEWYLSLVESAQTASVGLLSHLSTARPTGEYFPLAKVAGARSWPLSPTKILKINKTIPLPYTYMASKLITVKRIELDVTRSNGRYSGGKCSRLGRRTKHHKSHLRPSLKHNSNKPNSSPIIVPNTISHISDPPYNTTAIRPIPVPP